MEFIVSLLPLIVMMGIMYFLMIRPQKQQAVAKQNMLDNMKPGDSVITIGGLHGIVDEVSQSSNTVVIDCEGVYLTFNLNAIATVKQGGNIIDRQEEIEAANEIAEENYEAELRDETDDNL